MTKNRKIPVLILLFLILLLFAYWWKCQYEIDIYESFHLGEYLPVQALQHRESIVFANESGEILEDNYDLPNISPLWSKLWMREEEMVEQKYDSNGIGHSRCLLIQNKGEKDWSYHHNVLVDVVPGEILSFEGYVKTSSKATAALSVVLYDREKKVIKWHYAMKNTSGAKDWVKMTNKFAIPEDVSFIRFRLTGYGAGKVWFDNIVFRKEGKISPVQDLKPLYILESDSLLYRLNLKDRLISVEDKRINKEWVDKNSLKNSMVVGVHPLGTGKIKLRIINAEFMDEYEVTVTLSAGRPEVKYEINKDAGSEFHGLEFPQIFNWDDALKLVAPIQEGMLVPKDFAINAFPYTLRNSGSWPMAFVGVTDGQNGWMEILETPNDFEILRSQDDDGRLTIKNRWISQKGRYGYNRQINYCFFDKGGYVAMAKRYREYAKEKGLLLTLEEKEHARKGNLQKLLGAVDLWYWGKDEVTLIKELTSSGIKKVLFSNTDSWSIRTVNEHGFLSSVYDIYQDVWPPIYRELKGRHEGWPEDLVLDEKGQWIKGWITKKGLKEYQGGVICSIPGLERAKRQIPKELQEKPYTARFIDTTTASAWRECYNPEHPTTRTEDIKYKMKLLQFCSEEMGLVTGSEDGASVAVPYVDYFEGMMSPSIGRLPDSGRNVTGKRYAEPTDNFLKYQVGTKYKIPLWELVFHDCVVSTWYWGDSSNLISEVWYKRDLFNILYGNMPLWSIPDWDYWKKYRNRFIECYKNVCPVFEKVGYAEMLTHRFITDDHNVQETTFSNSVRIVVNFGDAAFNLDDGSYLLPAHGFVVFENDKIWKEGKCS